MPNTLDAVAFYEANAAAVDAYGMAHLADCEERQLFRQGARALEAELQAAISSRRPERNLYSRDEVESLFSLYLSGMPLQDIPEAFMVSYPEQQHSRSSLYQAVSQIRTLDSHYPEDVQWAVKSLFREVGSTIDPERFC